MRKRLSLSGSPETVRNAAVLKDDLLALDEVLKQEQALSLSLRGLEQRRLKLPLELIRAVVAQAGEGDVVQPQFPDQLQPPLPDPMSMAARILFLGEG